MSHPARRLLQRNEECPLLLLIALLALACSAALAQTPRDDAFAALDVHFRKFMADQHVPGLVYGVVADGRLVRVGAFGVQDTATRTPVDADSVFRIASMSKQLVALATLKLRDAGRLELDAPAARYVPELAKLRYATTDSPKIRVRDLLSHAAGFVTDDPWGDRQLDMTPADFSRFVAAGVPMARAPGMAYEYSNFGYALVGRVVTNRARMNFADYVTRRFLAPLHMDATVYDIAKIPKRHRAIGYRWENDAWLEEPALGPGEFGAMGGVATSANDYAKYVAWVLAAWPPRDGTEDTILARASVREIARPQVYAVVAPSLEPNGCARAVSYGFGVNTNFDCALGFHFAHSGGLPGFGSNVLFMPDRGLAVFAFTNRTYAPASRATREAAYVLARSGAFPARSVDASPAVLAMAAAAARIYERGDVTAEPAALAENLLLDRGAALRNAELAKLAAKLGRCDFSQPPAAEHALQATLTAACERGTLKVTLLLAPTTPPSLQRLEFAE